MEELAPLAILVVYAFAVFWFYTAISRRSLRRKAQLELPGGRSKAGTGKSGEKSASGLISKAADTPAGKLSPTVKETIESGG